MMINLTKINVFFGNLGRQIVRFRWLNILIFLLVLGASFPGMKKIQFDTSWDNWFLDGDPMKAADDEFKEIFGNNEYVAVLVESDDVFRPDILAKIRELGRDLKKNVPFADDIVSIGDCEFTTGTDEGLEVGELIPEAIPQSKEALNKIREKALSKKLFLNKIVSDDSKQTWIILRLKTYPDGWRSEKNIGPDIYTGMAALKIINHEKYRILNPTGSGLPVLAAEKTKFFKKEMARTMLLSIIATIIVLALAIRTVKGVLIPMVTAFSTVIIIFGTQGHLGMKIDPGMVLVPVYLGLAVAIGYSIHIFSFFNREFAKTGKRKESVYYAIEESGWPVFFTALTTIGALISFHFIAVGTIRWVGTTASSLVALTFIITVILAPSLLSFGRDKKPQKNKKPGGLSEKLLLSLSYQVMDKPKTILTVFALIFVICAAGLARFEVCFDIRKTYGLKIPYIQRMNHVAESKVGSIYSYNLTINFKDNGDAKTPLNLSKFESLIKEVQGYKLTKKTSSVVEIIKDMNQALNSGNPEYYKIPETSDMIAQLLLLYENAGGAEAEKWVDYDYKRLRVQIDMGDYNSLEAKNELIRLKKSAQALFPDAQIGFAGSIPKFTVMQDVVSRGQLTSFAIALLVITFFMMVVFGSVKIGLIAMIPNISPALAVGGIMGWMDIPLDMMTITIMPMLLGLAVDDTIHFINHMHLEYERTGSYRTSISRTFSTIGTALLMTSVIITANFSVYTTSIAKVYVHLGVLTGIGIMTALFADYFVTPVLIMWSKPFDKKKNQTDTEAVETCPEPLSA